MPALDPWDKLPALDPGIIVNLKDTRVEQRAVQHRVDTFLKSVVGWTFSYHHEYNNLLEVIVKLQVIVCLFSISAFVLCVIC